MRILEDYFQDLIHLPFLWLIAMTMDHFANKLDDWEPWGMVYLVFIGFPITLISLVLCLPLLFITPFWWIFLAFYYERT